MKRPYAFGLSLLAGVAVLALVIPSCDYGTPQAPPLPPGSLAGAGAGAVPEPAGPEATGGNPAPDQPPTLGEHGLAMLQGAIHLIERAAENPGGTSYEFATENLNQVFAERAFDAVSFRLSEDQRAYLIDEMGLPESALTTFENRKFDNRDTRHIEDCLMYQMIANRVAGEGDDLTRVRRVFDWVVRQILLVPAGQLSVAKEDLPHVPARPYDVLVRGMATEEPRHDWVWSERAWLFVSLCRQLGIDAGMAAYLPRGVDKPVAWACVALVDGKPYVFDTRIGLEVPSPSGRGVATLDEAATDPGVLDRLDLPGQSYYGTTQADLATGRIVILVDSSPGYFAPRMKRLQDLLASKYRMILYCDPAAQHRAFRRALGPRFGGTRLWELPLVTISELFTNPKFGAASRASLALFRPELPMLTARITQLRGELTKAKQMYVSFRYPDQPVMQVVGPKVPIARDEQDALNRITAYFLALCHLESKDYKQGRDLFAQAVQLLPDPGPGTPIYAMYRWGALSNLGRLQEEAGQLDRAIETYCTEEPTPEYHGHLLRARELVWDHPLASSTVPESPSPEAGAADVKTTARLRPR